MSRHARRGETWTRAQALKNDAIYLAAAGALFVLRQFSPRRLRAFGRMLGAIAYLLFAPARRVALANIARAFPGIERRDAKRLARRTFLTLGAHLGDAAAHLDPRRPIDLLAWGEDSRATLANAIAEGRGVVFASAHLGPWERVAATLVAHGIPLTTLVRESYDARFDRLFEALRAPRGVRAIPRGDVGAATRIVRTLRRGGVLGAPMDLRSRVASIDAPFFGEPASTAIGPARIALRTRAPVVVGTFALDSHGEPSVTTTRIETNDLEAGDVGELVLTTRINEELSRRIRATPEHWVWMHDRFAPTAESDAPEAGETAVKMSRSDRLFAS